MITVGVTSPVSEGESVAPKLQSYLDGVKRAGALRVAAYAVEPEPGVRVIEGLEATAERHPFYLGVQWHPEELGRPAVGGDPGAPDVRALFTALLEAAQQHAARRSGALRS